MLFWKRLAPFGAACVLLVSLVPCAFGNPDGPIGSVALEPGFTMSGSHDLRQLNWYQRANHGLWDSHYVNRRFEYNAERYSFGVLWPATRSITFGAHYAYTNVDTNDSSPGMRIEIGLNSWEVGFRMRYWFNLPNDEGHAGGAGK